MPSWSGRGQWCTFRWRRHRTSRARIARQPGGSGQLWGAEAERGEGEGGGGAYLVREVDIDGLDADVLGTGRHCCNMCEEVAVEGVLFSRERTEKTTKTGERGQWALYVDLRDGGGERGGWLVRRWVVAGLVGNLAFSGAGPGLSLVRSELQVEESFPPSHAYALFCAVARHSHCPSRPSQHHHNYPLHQAIVIPGTDRGKTALSWRVSCTTYRSSLFILDWCLIGTLRGTGYR